jgi:hypothetical protein
LAFFISRGFTPVVLPIVDAAISDLVERSKDENARRYGRRIREEIDDSIIDVLAYEKDIEREVNIINGRRVAANGILPGAIDADTIMLAEAADFGVYALLTPRPCFTSANHESLKVALVDCGFPQSLIVFSPKEIGEYLEERERRSVTERKEPPPPP